MKRFSLILSAVLFAISISASAIQIPAADVQARLKANPSLTTAKAANGLKRAPQQTQTCTVEASEFAPGIGLIKFAPVTYAMYKTYFDYAVIISDAEGMLGYGWFDSSDGETGVTTAAILGDTLAPGTYTIAVEVYYTDDEPWETGAGTLTIANAATAPVITVSDLTAVNSEDLSTTTISWKQEGQLPEGGFTYIQISSSGESVFNSLTDPNYGQKAINSPITVSLPKDKDYFIYLYEFYPQAQAMSQYVAFAYKQHSVGVNPFTPVNLQAAVDGTEVTFTWASYKADSVPAMTAIYFYDAEGNTLSYELLKHTGATAVGQTYSSTFDAETTFGWGVRPVAADYYFITQLQKGENFTTGKDNKKPVIDSVKTGDITTTSIELLVFAQDNYSDEDSLVYTVKNGETELLKAKADEGVLVLEGLTINTEYNLSIIATDEAGNASEPFAIQVKTSNDTQAPVITVATLQKATDHKAYLKVAATDNETAAEDIVFIITIQGVAEPLEMKANDSIIIVKGFAASTAHSLTIAAKDKSGNVSAATDAIAFTTAAHTPITLAPQNAIATYLGTSAGYQFFQLNLYGPRNNSYLPDIYLTILAEQATKISGTYTSSIGNLWLNPNYTSIQPDAEEDEPFAIASAELTLTFKEYKERSGVNMPVYDIAFNIVDEFGVEYNGTMSAARMTTYQGQSQVEIITDETNPGTAVDNIETGVKATKRIENGQLIIDQNGVQYNVLGVTIK
ncbi:MAG: hypothetical protein J5688_02820 [Paludibacteraceae bacterium]|nr:hypothetical protein [Paludibacteraceae bacterium]